LDALPDLITVQDPEFTIRWVNAAVAGATGAAPEALVGQKCYRAYQQRDDPCDGCPAVETHRTGRAAAGGRTVPGGPRLAQESTPILDAQGRLVATIQVARDVTEREAVSRRLIERERFAALGEMAAAVGHELNNFLCAISIRAGLLPEKLERLGLEAARDLSDELVEAVQRVAYFTRGLIDMGKREVHFEVASLNELVEQTIAFAKPQNLFDRVEFETALDPNLPTVLADSTQVQQALLNLYMNAAEAMGAGWIRTTTRVQDGEAEPEPSPRVPGAGLPYALTGDFVELAVTDPGPGVPSDVLDRLYRPPHLAMGPDGGFGLATVYRVVRSHRGELRVESAPGQGTTVRIRLPLGDRVVLLEAVRD